MLLILAQVAIGVFAFAWIFLGAFNVSCLSNCRYELTGTAILTMLIACIAIPIATLVLTVVLRHRNSDAKGVALIGCGLLTVVFALCLAFERAAIDPDFLGFVN